MSHYWLADSVIGNTKLPVVFCQISIHVHFWHRNFTVIKLIPARMLKDRKGEEKNDKEKQSGLNNKVDNRKVVVSF